MGSQAKGIKAYSRSHKGLSVCGKIAILRQHLSDAEEAAAKGACLWRKEGIGHCLCRLLLKLSPPQPLVSCMCAPFRLLRAQILKLRRPGLNDNGHNGAGRLPASGPFTVSQFTFNAQMEASRRQRVPQMMACFVLGKERGRKTLLHFFRSSLAIRKPLWHGIGSL